MNKMFNSLSYYYTKTMLIYNKEAHNFPNSYGLNSNYNNKMERKMYRKHDTSNHIKRHYIYLGET